MLIVALLAALIFGVLELGLIEAVQGTASTVARYGLLTVFNLGFVLAGRYFGVLPGTGGGRLRRLGRGAGEAREEVAGVATGLDESSQGILELAAEAELKALRAQINPHFLFNVLNTVVAHIGDDPVTARQLITRLADFLRYSLRQTGQLISFQEEFSYVKTYLYLEKARYGDRLQVIYHIDPQVLGAQVPALVVQPLVENAVRHGVAPKVGRGSVILSAHVDFLHMRLNVTVADDGVGIPPERLEDLLTGPADRERGVGLRNVNERLKRLYGESYGLQIRSRPGRGTRVHFRIPIG